MQRVKRFFNLNNNRGMLSSSNETESEYTDTGKLSSQSESEF